MTNNNIRKEFANNIGKEKYIHFVLTLYEAFPLRNKLFFWQEQLLSNFSRKFDIPQISVSNIYEIFNHCPIHDYELIKDTVPVVDGNRANTNLTQTKELCPLANIDAPRNLEMFDYSESIEVLYCTICREIRKTLH
jgi:hypothetical protein